MVNAGCCLSVVGFDVGLLLFVGCCLLCKGCIFGDCWLFFSSTLVVLIVGHLLFVVCYLSFVVACSMFSCLVFVFVWCVLFVA